MADKNFNQGNQSHQDWERERQRHNQDDWSSQNYGNSNYGESQNRSANQGYRDVGYSGDSARGMGSESQDKYNRVNYIPDNNDNRDYNDRQTGSNQYSSSGNYGNRDSRSNFNQGSYGNFDRTNYGNAGNQGNYGNQGWNERTNYGGSAQGNQYGNEGDWSRRQSQQSGSWGTDYGRQDWGRGNVDTGNWGNQQNDYGNRNAGNWGNEHRSERQWQRSNYGSANRRDDNDNLWDRTKNKVSSWFNDDDDNRNRGNRDYNGGHRGKGPSDYRRSQDRIREDICDRLTDDDRVDASNIRVQMEDDAVILSGTVNSREEKRRAEDLVESISGVRNVENRLRVGTGSGPERHFASHDYTGATDRTGNIGTESGTTNEIIQNVQNDERNANKKNK